MATIDDIAKAAGVSHGTVSKVLNGVAGVSLNKINKVEAAAKKLNYRPNARTRSLAMKSKKNIDVILPTIDDVSFAHLYHSLSNIAAQMDYTTTLRLSNEVPKTEQDLLNASMNSNSLGVILMTCQPQNGKFFEKFIRHGLNIVFIHRDVPGYNFNFVGLDPKSAIIDDIAKKRKQGYTNFALITGPREYSYEAECIDGYLNAMITSGLSVRDNYIETANFNFSSAMHSATRLFNLEEPPEIIYVSNELLARGVSYIMSNSLSVGSQKYPRIVRLLSDSWESIRNEEDIALPYTNLAKSAFDILLQAQEDTSKPSLNSRVTIWNPPSVPIFIPKAVSSAENSTIQFAMSGAPANYSIHSIIAEFTKKTGIQINLSISESTPEDSYNQLHTLLNSNDLDIFIADLPWLSSLMRMHHLLNLSEYLKDEKFYLDLFSKNILSEFGYQHNKLYALPFSFTVQLLFYRKDLFDNPKNQRHYFEMFKSTLQPPKTWDEFNQIARFFTREYNNTSPTSYGTALFSYDCLDLLPRIWSYGGEYFKDGEIIYNREAHIRSVESFNETINYIPNKKLDQPTHFNNVQRFLDGDIAMIPAFTDWITSLRAKKRIEIAGKMAFAPLPGNISVRGGLIVGINPRSKRIPETIEFLRWLLSFQVCEASTILGRFTPLSSFFENSDMLSLYPWNKNAIKVFENSRNRPLYINKNTNRSCNDEVFQKTTEYLNQLHAGELTSEDVVARMEQTIRDCITK